MDTQRQGNVAHGQRSSGRLQALAGAAEQEEEADAKRGRLSLARQEVLQGPPRPVRLPEALTSAGARETVAFLRRSSPPRFARRPSLDRDTLSWSF